MIARVQVVIGAVLAFVVMALWFSNVPGFFDALEPPTRFDQLMLGLSWSVVLQLPLLLGIFVVAQQRFWSSKHVDGSAPRSGSALDINRRYLTNTLEQSALATVGLLALSVHLPPAEIGFVPTVALLFVLGRACFWLAYHINPLARAMGFVMTVVPTVGVYAYILWRLATQPA